MARDFKSRFILSGEDRTAAAFASVNRSAGQTIAKFAAFAGIGLSIDAVIDKTKQAIATFDNIAKTADKIGISTDALQELRHAADLSNVSVEQMDKALTDFVRRTGEAVAGTGTAREEFERLGIALRDGNGQVKAAEDLFNEVVAAMQRVESQTERARIAYNLFGRAGVSLTNLTNEGARGIAAMRKEAHDLGIVVEEDMLRSAEEANDELARMQKIVDTELNKALFSLKDLLIDGARLMAFFADATGNAHEAFGQLTVLMSGIGPRYLDLKEKQAEVTAELEEQRRLMAEEIQRSGLIYSRELDKIRSKIVALAHDQGMLNDQLAELEPRVKKAFGIGIETPRPPELPGGGEGIGQTDAEKAKEQAEIDAHTRALGRMTERFEAFRIGQEGELALIRFNTQQEHEILAEALAAKAVSLEEFNARRIGIEENYYARVGALEEDRQRRYEAFAEMQKSIAIGNATDILGVLGKHFKALHFLQQASSLSSTVMKTIESVQAALTIPPPTGWIYAGINAAAGAANIASILATSFGSSGGKAKVPSGGGGGAAARPSVPALPSPQDTAASRPRGEMLIRVEGLGRDGLWTMEAARQLADLVNKAQEDGYRVRITR